MTLNLIRKKIQSTRLFSDPQKIELLVRLENASDEDVRRLEEGIDAFDAAYNTALAMQGQRIKTILDDITAGASADDLRRNQSAIDEVRMGMTLLAS